MNVQRKGLRICDVFRDLVPFLKCKKHEKHLLRSVILKSNTPPWVFFAFYKSVITDVIGVSKISNDALDNLIRYHQNIQDLAYGYSMTLELLK